MGLMMKKTWKDFITLFIPKNRLIENKFVLKRPMTKKKKNFGEEIEKKA